MDNFTFKAGEAGEISGVPPLMQRDWRRRGVLPAFEGERARFSLREVCRFRLIRAYSDLGSSLTNAATFAEAFSPDLSAAVFARLRSIDEPFKNLAMVTFFEGRKPDCQCVNDGQQPFIGAVPVGNAVLILQSQIILNLTPLADEMAEKIELVGIDRRVEALDEETAKRGL